jgi:hypothetical protein
MMRRSSAEYRGGAPSCTNGMMAISGGKVANAMRISATI